MKRSNCMDKKVRKVPAAELRMINKRLSTLAKSLRVKREDNISKAASLLTESMDILAKEFSLLDLEKIVAAAVKGYVKARVKDLRSQRSA